MPFAVTWICSAHIGPDELHRVVSVPAFDDVASVARIPGEGVVAGAHQGDVVALASVHRVVPVTAEQHVVAQAAEELVVSGAPVEREDDRLSREAGRRDVVVAVETLDDERVARLLVVKRHLCGEAGDGEAACALVDANPVRAVRSVHDHAIRLAIGPAEVGVHALDVGSRQVVDRDEIRSAESVEVDALDAGRVHRDVGLGAEEAEPVSVRRQLDLLGDVGAVEAHRVRACLALDRVAAVAGIPDERVVACTHERAIGPAVAVDRVVPVATEQEVGALAAGDRVVAGPAVERQGERLGREHRRGQRVVPAEPSDDELVTRLLMLNGDHCPEAGHDDARGIPADSDRVVRIRAVHLDPVVLTVAGRPTRGAGEIEVQVRELRALQIVDGDDVGPAESVEIDPLQSCEVHRHVADVAGEPDMRPVRGHRDVLRDSRAVEAHRVGAGFAVDAVAPVAGIPDEGVVSGAEQDVIAAAVSVDQVGPGAAEQRLRSGSADERVVSGSAVQQRLDPAVNTPFRSSMRTRSLPAPAWTLIRATCFRLKLKSALPSSPTSTWRIRALPAFRRSAILSLARVPSMVSEPRLSLGRWILWVAALALEATTALASTRTATASSRPKRKRLIFFFVFMASFR